LNAIVVSIRFILLILGGQKQVALENAALRPATGRVQTQRSAAEIEQQGSVILDRPLPGLAGLETRVDIRAARNRNVLESRAVHTVLAEVIPTETPWPTTNPFRDPETHPHDGHRQSNMGSTSNPWRT